MDPQTAFLIGVLAAGAVASAAATYLQRHLRGILIDLCGNEARADYWIAFTNVTLIGVTVVCALLATPDVSGAHGSLILQLAAQLRCALVGMIGTVVASGMMIARFIPKPSARPAGPGGTLLA